MVALVTPVERLSHGTSLHVRNLWSNYIDLRHTRQQNDQLQKEVARLRRELDVLEARQVWIAKRVVSHPSERPPNLRSRSPQIPVIDPTRRCPGESPDDGQHRRLPRPVGAMEHRDASALELQRYPGQSPHGAVGLPHVLEADHGFRPYIFARRASGGNRGYLGEAPAPGVCASPRLPC